MQAFQKLPKNSFLFLRIGIFFLVSAPSLASIFLFAAIIFSFIKDQRDFLNNKWNYPFFIATFLLLFSSILVSTDIQGWSPSQSWLGLGNWIPYFLFYFAIQGYVKTYENRKKIIYTFISGSVPLLFSVFGQYYFNWTGPLGIFNNFIIWFQRPLSWGQGVTGIFNNPNYAGSWFLIIWPMCLASIREEKLKKYQRLILLIFIFSIFLSIMLTFSRNAWLGSLVTFVSMGKLYSALFLIFVFSIAIIFLVFLIFSFLPYQFEFTILDILPIVFRREFLNIGFDNIQNFPRAKIWIAATQFIAEKPLTGWGAASFPILFNLQNNIWYGHAHNLPLDIAHSYGLPVSLLITFTIILILYRSFKIIYLQKDPNHKSLFDKAWWTATFTFYLSQMVDIQYFDIRIGIAFWILLAGLVSIIRFKKLNNY